MNHGLIASTNSNAFQYLKIATILLLLSSLVACGEKSNTANAIEANPSKPSILDQAPSANSIKTQVVKPPVMKKIGLAWAGESGMAKRITAGLLEVLDEYEGGFEIENCSNLESIKSLGDKVKEFETDKSAMILLRSSGAKFLSDYSPTIPTFIGACNHPVQLGAVPNMHKPGGNVTGVTYALSYDHQLKAFEALIPNLKSICLIYEAGHPGSSIDRAGTSKTAKNMGIRYSEKACQNSEDVLEAVSQAAKSCSAIILGNQALVFESAKPLVEAAGKTPLLSYSAKPVKQGVLCGLAADDHKLGRMLGQSIVSVLRDGVKAGSIAIKIDDMPKLHINLSTAQRIGLSIPTGVLGIAKIVK